MTSTATEKELERYVASGCNWEKLPAHVKAVVDGNQVKFANFVVKFALQRRLSWASTSVREYVADEKKYYDELIKRSRTNLMIYPYHLTEEISRTARITPFQYYLEMMQEVMLSERSYDTIPNFTAADGVRLLGIGRNEYIDIMNRFRSRGWNLLKKRKTTLRELLPRETVFHEPEFWWLVWRSSPVAAGMSPTTIDEEVKQCDEQEKAVLTLLERASPLKAGTLDKQLVINLYKRGLIYLTVPIKGTDLVSVPPLENFVMNRVQGDFFENLLYDVFVSIDERTTVDQLAEVLQVSSESVSQAVSVYCMLGMAKNKSVDIPRPNQQWHDSWIPKDQLVSSPQSQQPAQSDFASLLLESTSNSTNTPQIQNSNGSNNGKRIGLIFDSTLTAFLMMGNLGSGLKMHAVTMFEVGKLADETMDDFIEELNKVVPVAEGEAQRYADHAICLGSTLKFLRKNSQFGITDCDGGVDLLRCERLNALDKASLQRVLSKNYAVLVSMAPITAESAPVCTVIPHHFGPVIPEANSLWMRMFVRMEAKSGPSCVLFARGSRIRRIPSVFNGCKTVMLHSWGHEGVIHNLSQLLPALNFRLQSSSVLVEAYSYVNATTNQEHFDVPLPFIENETKSPNEEVMNRLHKSLELDKACGYVRFAKLPGDNQQEWVVDHLAFGIPIFNRDLNSNVCKLSLQQKLFTNEKLKVCKEVSQSIAVRLINFIVKSSNQNVSRCAIQDIIDANTVVTPSCHIVFHQGSLETFDSW